jgi:hypothetical protein
LVSWSSPERQKTGSGIVQQAGGRKQASVAISAFVGTGRKPLGIGSQERDPIPTALLDPVALFVDIRLDELCQVP